MSKQRPWHLVCIRYVINKWLKQPNGMWSVTLRKPSDQLNHLSPKQITHLHSLRGSHSLLHSTVSQLFGRLYRHGWRNEDERHPPWSRLKTIRKTRTWQTRGLATHVHQPEVTVAIANTPTIDPKNPHGEASPSEVSWSGLLSVGLGLILLRLWSCKENPHATSLTTCLTACWWPRKEFIPCFNDKCDSFSKSSLKDK